MKKFISNFASNLLSKEDLKQIKGGYMDGCGSCMSFGGWELPCLAIGGPWGCRCATFNPLNGCG
jgi:hypothetical protein